MFNSAFCAGAVSLMIAAGAMAATVAPQTPDQWRQAAVADIEAAYRITLDNHPGAHDPANPAFTSHLANARGDGLALAAQVRDGSGYLAALQRFNTQIHDGHAGVTVLNQVVKIEPRWP